MLVFWVLTRCKKKCAVVSFVMFVPAFVTSRQRVYRFSWYLVFIGTVKFWFRSKDSNERFAWRSEVIEHAWIAHCASCPFLSWVRLIKCVRPLIENWFIEADGQALYQDGDSSAHVRFVSLHVNSIAFFLNIYLWFRASSNCFIK
jgi:hypothetical protein